MIKPISLSGTKITLCNATFEVFYDKIKQKFSWNIQSYNHFLCMGIKRNAAYPADVIFRRSYSVKEDTPHDQGYSSNIQKTSRVFRMSLQSF